jgi:hypothetical protein
MFVLGVVIITFWPPWRIDLRQEAYHVAQEYVQSRLKAPATAEFQSYSKDAIEVVTPLSSEGGCYKVRIVVDAQNGFGALIRHKYNVELFYVPTTGKVECVWLTDVEYPVSG